MHTYILISAAWTPCFPPPRLSGGEAADALRAELIQKCICASELFTYTCMMIIPRLIRDKSRRRRPHTGGRFFPLTFSSTALSFHG